MIRSSNQCGRRACRVSWTLLAAVLWTTLFHLTSAQDKTAPQFVAAWAADLQSEDVSARRRAAVLTRSADNALQQQLLPVMIELLMTEKDGQVRLAVFDTVTDMGAAANSAIPALVHTLRTDYGGKENEELHQDYRSALALAAIGEPAVEALRGLLVDQKENVLAEAATALGRIGHPAAAAIPDLLPLFGNEQARVRQEASEALGRIGAPALEPLLVAARRDEVAFRVGAIQALGLFSTSDGRAVQAVLDATRDAESQVRAAAVKSLAAYEVPTEVLVEVLLENLRHDNKTVRAAVVDVLVHQRELLRQLEPELSRLLTEEQDGVAWHAAFLLQQIGVDAAPTLVKALQQNESRIEQISQALALLGRPVVDLLVRALDDPAPRVRQGAALALGQIRPLSNEIVQKLAAGLDDSDRQVQAAFLTSIGHLGSRGSAAVPAVRRKLQDESAEIREQAIGILFEAAPRDGRLMDELSAMISDDDPRVQRRAIDAIRASGPLGRRALPAVIEKLKSPIIEVRVAAAAMIGSHGPGAAEAVPALTALLDDAEPELRVVVIQTLSQLGSAAQPAFEKLTLILDDDNVDVRAAAVQTLANLDLEPEQLRPYLAKALQDKESDVRRQALRGIRRFGRRGTIFVPDLILLAANDEQSGFLKRALQRYESYDIDPRSIPELMEHLKHEHAAVQLLAIRFLGIAGPAAKDAIPHLEPLTDDANEEIRKEAAAAIEKIKSDPAATSQRVRERNSS